MTAESSPSRASRLNGERSPWSHVGGPAHAGAASARSHAAAAAGVSISPAAAIERGAHGAVPGGEGHAAVGVVRAGEGRLACVDRL